MSKISRQISIVVSLLLILGGAYFYRYFEAQKAPPKRKPPKKEVLRPVAVLPVLNQQISTQLDVQGRLVAFEKIDIIAEVSGRLIETAKPFKIGSYFKKEEALLIIDDTEARLSLLSQKANLMNAITQMMPDLKIDYPEGFGHWKTYLDQFDVEKTLPPFPEATSDQERYFVSSKNLHSQYYTIKSQEERLSKYRVTAPFSGVITQTAINAGSLVRSGQTMGQLMNNNNYELEANVRLADLKYVRPGSNVELYSNDLEGEWSGLVKRISDQIDPNTQTVIAYVSVRGTDLREGMYLRGKVKGKSVNEAIEIPRDLLVNQNAVFLVQPDSLLRLVNIEIESMGEKSMLVRGLEDGVHLLGELFPGAYNGQKVAPTNLDRSTASK
ncbi:MAG: HlyD family efflux transporter periplasmic adaptor subunit [Bacteroidota bacterium]